MTFAASDIADAFDKKRRQRHADLEAWVQDNPQWWAVGLATVGASSMDFLGGYVDVLRLGEGSAEGGWKGVGSDALRLLAVIGPAARLGQKAGSLAKYALLKNGLRIAHTPIGISGPCTYRAANNVAQLAKGRDLFFTLKEMARAVGKNVKTLSKKPDGTYELGAFMDDLVPSLRTAGIKVSTVAGLDNVRQVIALAQRTKGVVVFAFKVAVKTPDGKIRNIHHTVIACKGPLGSVRFADYGGKVFNTLEALIARWGKPSENIALSIKPLDSGRKGASAFIAQLPRIDNHALVQAAQGLTQVAVTHGVAVVLAGVDLVETNEDGADFGLRVEQVATPLFSREDPAPAQVVAESLENWLFTESCG